ncbi:glycosyltransferase [Cuspidothrix issatschenkoi LEGE 03284]|uniref:glycosyltransferase n=1 Tax=Cuspidothrix issatschenkoi TaxID=230752 RepID=UPI00187EF407|nr:glycosyltransferase [Cuspidothrix issatschenkoi]MBE9231817.1 glycosyltransferase [Cuspidothrix issatschenkoi LEGE 03284]
MKVLHIIPSVAAVRGGPSQAILEMVKALRKNDIHAEIVTTNDNGKDLLDVPLGKFIDYQQVPVQFFPRFSPPINAIREFSYSGDFTIWLWKNIRNYDLLHIHGIFSYAPTVAMAIAHHQKVPYIITGHGQLCEWSLQQKTFKKQLYINLIAKYFLNHSQSIHCTSVAEQKEASPLNLTSSSFILPLGIYPPQKILNAREKLQKYLNIPADEPIILFLSRLHYVKGLDYLIPALGKLSHHRFTFIVAGSGDSDYETEIKTLVKTHGIEDRTHFTGFVKGETKDLLMQGADIFALTSYSENFGISVLESLAAGVPVIVTPGVALSDIVQEQHLGYVTELNITAIAATIENFLDHPQESKEMGDSYGALRYRARQFILDNYTWDKIALKMVSVYEDIIFRSPTSF